MTKSFIAQRLFDGYQFHHNVRVNIKQGKIKQLETNVDIDSTLEFVTGTVSAGFIDVQVNGGGGFLFNSSPKIEALEAMSQAHAHFGTSLMLPTVITDKLEIMTAAADSVANALKQGLPGILGIHFEGPHLAQPKKGVHEARYIRSLSKQELELYQRKDLGIKVLTIAPETVSPEQIKQLIEAGVIICLGHSNASFEQANLALAAGATGFTHLYNAMSALGSREPGMVGAAFANNESWCGIIIDGHHVSAGAAKIALNIKQDKIFLVTDAMSLIGTEETEFILFEHKIKRVADKLTTQGGTLAGSHLDMLSAVKNTVELVKQPLAKALQMASLRPAEFLGIDNDYGSIEIGKKANLIAFDSNYQLNAHWHEGRRLF